MSFSICRLNTLIRKGKYKYTFKNLPRIYCIGILGVSVFPYIADYHNVASLKKEKGELIDEQLAFITIELDKFNKELANVQTDLDKLIYTMKTIDTVTEPTQFPAFWTEEWLKRAIDELDTRKMTAEERAYFARVTAANAEAVNAEKQRIREAVEQKEIETVTRALKRGKLTIEEIAEDSGVSVDFVLDTQRRLAQN